MKRFVRTSLLAAAALSLAACSSGPKLGNGKQGAAQALFEASEGSGQTGQSMLMKRAMSQDINLDGSVEVPCQYGGTVTLSADLDSFVTTGTSVKAGFDLEYDDCNEDGKNEINGDMTMGIIADASSSSFSVAMHLKGEIDISGEVDDSLTADVTEYIGYNGSSNTVTLKLKGTIETSTEKYTYNDESFTFTEGALPVAEDDDEG